jgi:hypothetical protein
LLTALLLLTLSAAPPGPAAPASSSLAPFFLQPSRVQIFVADRDRSLLKPEEDREEDERPRLGMYVLTREGPELKAEERQAVAQLWVAPEDVTPRPPTACIFNPDIALRFWRGRTWVDVLVCLGCRQLKFYDANGATIDGGDFRDFTVLRKLALAAFPHERFGGR